MIYYSQVFLLTSVFITSSLVFSETVPSIEISNYQNDLAYIINVPVVVVGDNYKNACSHLAIYGYTWKIIPTTDVNPACYSSTDQKVMGADTWFCADGSLAYYNIPWWSCNAFKACPSPVWKLTSDKVYCTKPNTVCPATPTNVSELQLLAAIVYGEASVKSSYEEKAAIANAVVKFKNSYGYSTVNQLVAKKSNYSSAVHNKAIRYLLAMCSNVEVEYPDVYHAALNALDPNGIDYANGGCFWDGADLKTDGIKHKHYKKGYIFTDPSHDVLSIGNSLPVNKVGRKRGTFNYTYESTAGYGNTVFWKYTQDYMTAEGVSQCR